MKIKFTTFALITLALIIAATCSHAQTPLTIFATDSLIRPYNGTAYAANDVVNDTLTGNKLLTFKTQNVKGSGIGIVTAIGLGGTIISALLTAGDTANTANGTFKLLLFRDTVANVADNAAWATAAYYNTRFIGEIDFTLAANGTTSNYSYVDSLGMPFQCETDDIYLYGVLLAKAAYQPAANQKFIIKLGIVRN